MMFKNNNRKTRTSGIVHVYLFKKKQYALVVQVGVGVRQGAENSYVKIRSACKTEGTKQQA